MTPEQMNEAKAKAEAAAEAKRQEREAKKAAKETAKAEREAKKSAKVSNFGVTRPSENTKTGRVWAISDSISASKGAPAARKEVMEAATKEGINPATVATQYGRWRKHHGLKGTLDAPKPAGSDVQAQPAKQ